MASRRVRPGCWARATGGQAPAPSASSTAMASRRFMAESLPDGSTTEPIEQRRRLSDLGQIPRVLEPAEGGQHAPRGVAAIPPGRPRLAALRPGRRQPGAAPRAEPGAGGARRAAPRAHGGESRPALGAEVGTGRRFMTTARAPHACRRSSASDAASSRDAGTRAGPRQCAISTGTVIERRISRGAPDRECRHLRAVTRVTLRGGRRRAARAREGGWRHRGHRSHRRRSLQPGAAPPGC